MPPSACMNSNGVRRYHKIFFVLLGKHALLPPHVTSFQDNNMDLQAPEEKKKRLRAELLRWHPDKFTGHFAHYFAESDRQRILARVQGISQMLTAAGQATAAEI